MVLFRLLTGIGWSVAAGYLLVALLVGKAARQSFWFTASLAPGLGLGLASLNYFFWQVFTPQHKLYFIIGEGLILLVLLGLYLWRRPAAMMLPAASGGAVRAPWQRLLRILFTTALILATLVFLLGAVLTPLGTRDAWSIWNLDARYLFQGGEYWQDAFSVQQFNPDYPQLLPANVARLWGLAGQLTPLSPALTGFIFTFGVICLLVSGLKQVRGPVIAWLGGLVLLSASAFLVQGPSQVADIPLAYFYLAAALLFVIHDRASDPSRGWIVLAGFMTGLAGWTKNEGLLFLVGVILARLLAYSLNRDRRGYLCEMGAFLAGLLPVLLFIFYFKLALAPPSVLVAGQGESTLTRLMDGSRYAQIIKYFFQQSYQPLARRFTPFVLLLVLPLLLGVDHRCLPSRTWVSLGTLLICLLGGYFLVYLTTPLDLNWQLRTSFFRVALQIWPLTVFSVLVGLRLGRG